MSQTIQVSLPSSTLYVSGTVNGVATTWTNPYGSTWETTAARASNEIYLVELTIVNSFGESYVKSLTLFYGLLNLITDRTEEDLKRVATLVKQWQDGTITDEEKSEFLAGMKGAYNYTDLNRVENATQFVNDYLNSLQELFDRLREENGVADADAWIVSFATPVVLSHKIDWTAQDVPEGTNLDRYLSNVHAVAERIPVEHAMPETMDGLTVEGANEIERTLLAEHEAAQLYYDKMTRAINSTAAAFVRSGEVYGGEI